LAGKALQQPVIDKVRSGKRGVRTIGPCYLDKFLSRIAAMELKKFEDFLISGLVVFLRKKPLLSLEKSYYRRILPINRIRFNGYGIWLVPAYRWSLRRSIGLFF
jgi:hypothetical protein